MNASEIIKLSVPTIIPIILCGGAGSRLWPLSQEEKPKQLLPIINKTILLHDTLERVQYCVKNGLKHTIIVTTEHLKKETEQELERFNPDSTHHILCEPCSKNTAVAIAYASLYAQKTFGKNALLWILPADHYVEDHEGLANILGSLHQNFPENKILTFGVRPTYPATEYGYINPSRDHVVNDVVEFIEKPNQATAEKYYNSQNYLWNSGMFMAQVKTLLNEFIDHAPSIISILSNALQNNNLKKAYYSLEAISFDHAIMEKTNNAVVIEADIGWSDVGSWQHIWQLKDKDLNGNVIEGNVITNNSHNCLIQSNNLTIAAIGLENIAIIEDGHSLLIADKKNAQNMKKVSALITEKNINQEMTKQEKFCTKSSDYIVKEITLYQGESITHHYHQCRSEQWVVLSGTAHIKIGDEELDYEVGANIHIPLTTRHSVRNLSELPLKLLEIQYGANNNPFDIIYTDNTDQAQMERV